MPSRIQVRRDTAANWIAANPVLAQGEFGYAYDTDQLKVGDGTSTWTALSTRESSGRELAHASSDTQVTVTSVIMDIPDLDVIVFEVTDKPVYVELIAPWFNTLTTTATWGGITIADENNVQKSVSAITFRNAANIVSSGTPAIERIDVPGTYTRKGRVQAGVNNSIQLNSGLATTSVTLRAIER